MDPAGRIRWSRRRRMRDERARVTKKAPAWCHIKAGKVDVASRRMTAGTSMRANRPETGTRDYRSSPSLVGAVFAHGMGHSRSPGRAARAVAALALVPAARKAPASFSPWRARISRGLRARSVTFCLWTAARIDARVCRGSGFNLRDVFPTGCVEGRAEGAARSPGRGLRRGAELDRPRPQPVVDGVECFDQLVVPWILRIE